MKISFKEILQKRRVFLSENLIFSVNQGVSAETSQPGEILQLLILTYDTVTTIIATTVRMKTAMTDICLWMF